MTKSFIEKLLRIIETMESQILTLESDVLTLTGCIEKLTEIIEKMEKRQGDPAFRIDDEGNVWIGKVQTQNPEQISKRILEIARIKAENYNHTKADQLFADRN